MILLKDGNSSFEIYSNIINNKNIYYLKLNYLNDTRILLNNKYLIYKFLYIIKHLSINLNKNKYIIDFIKIKLDKHSIYCDRKLSFNLYPKYIFSRYYEIENYKDLLINYVELLMEKIIINDIIKK